MTQQLSTFLSVPFSTVWCCSLPKKCSCTKFVDA